MFKLSQKTTCKNYWPVAQLVERLTVNQNVPGSSPGWPANNGDVGKLVTPVDCKSAASGTAGSTPAVSTILTN